MQKFSPSIDPKHQEYIIRRSAKNLSIRMRGHAVHPKTIPELLLSYLDRNYGETLTKLDPGKVDYLLDYLL